jgi:hypothetical protein
MRETRLTHNALAHHTPGHAHSDLIRLQLFTTQVAIARMQLGSERVASKVIRIGIALRAQFGELPTPLRNQLVLIGQKAIVVHVAIDRS